MAEIINCPECGRLFAADGSKRVCSKCLEKEDSEYGTVRKYIRDHPGASVFEVSEATGIEEQKILQFLKDGRLQSSGYVEIAYCERCGKKISAGRLCDNCRAQVNHEVRSAIPSQTSQPKVDRTPKGGRMFLKDSDNTKKS
ncbi:MAG: TIGR03826 family flagellar region protein [Syntrophomonas sp.]